MRFTAAGFLRLADEVEAEHERDEDGLCRRCLVADCAARRHVEEARRQFGPQVCGPDPAATEGGERMHGNGNSSGPTTTRKGSLGGQINTEHWWKRA